MKYISHQQEMEDKMENLIKVMRTKFGLTQQQMADDTGISREYINKMEKGKMPISLKTEQLINQAYAEGYVDKNSQTANNVTSKSKKGSNSDFGINELNLQSLHTLIESNTRMLQELQQQNSEIQLNFSVTLKNLSESFKKVVDSNAELVGLLKGKEGGKGL